MKARKSMLVFETQIIIAILGWIGLIILTKFWGTYAPEALGMIGYALSFVGLFSILASIGFSQAHVKRISEGKDLGTCIGTFIVIKVLLIALMIVSIFSFMFISKTFFATEFSDTTNLIIYIFVVYYIFGFLMQIPANTFEGKGEIAKRQIAIISESVVKLIFRIVVVLAGVTIAGKVIVSSPVVWPSFLQPLQTAISNFAVDSIAMTYVAGSLTTFLVGVWLMRKYPIKKPTKEMMKSYLIFAIPVSLVTVSTVITRSIDKVMLGYFWTSVEVGYYFTVQQISQFVLVLATSLSVVLFPALSYYHSKNNHAEIKSLVNTSIRYVSMLIIPIIVFIVVFSDEIILVMLSSAFLPGSSSLIVLSLFSLISGLMVPYISLITGVNKPKIVAKIGVIMCVSNVLLNLLFIPVYGTVGAAFASLISVTIGFLIGMYEAKKLSGIKYINKHIPLHIIAGVCSGWAIYLVKSLFVEIRWYHLGMFSILCVLIYVLVLYFMFEFTRKDFDFFIDTINLRKMKDYIKGEIGEN